MNRAAELQKTALLVAFIGLAIALVRIRTSSIDELERRYDAIRLGHSANLGGELRRGPVPQHIENFQFWRAEGDRAAAERWSVSRAGAFVQNYVLVIGVDARGAVVYKAIGNT